MKTHFTVGEVMEALDKRAKDREPAYPLYKRAYMLGHASTLLAMVASGEITVDQLREALEK